MSRKCLTENCNTIAIFGFEYQKRISCKKHIEYGMKDVVNIKCNFPDCEKQPTYGIFNSKAIR